MPSLIERCAQRPWLSRTLGLSFAMASGLLLACPLQLPGGVSCGDGWWDPSSEPCDPSDPDSPHIGACGSLGFEGDGICDPSTCELIVDEDACNVCGDGIAGGDEQCDGADLRGQVCSAVGTLRCNEDCTLDYDGCAAVCGDGIVSDTEECDPQLKCATDSDCGEGKVCYEVLGECINIGDNYAPQLACSAYETLAPGFEKPYASGTISACTDQCTYGRDDCGFCGDGQLDESYHDVVGPGVLIELPGEFCDGDSIERDDLIDHCEPLCLSEPVNADVTVLCDFQCAPDCKDFAPVIIPDPSPESLNCCVEKGSPCPKFGLEGVPDLPCCSWLANPDWAEEEKCVVEDSEAIPVTYVCP